MQWPSRSGEVALALRPLVGQRRVLARGTTDEGEVLGTKDRLIFAAAGGARTLGWQEVERGSWDAETKRISWVEPDASEHALQLIEVGRLPALFSERVAASIALVRQVSPTSGGTASITARRDLGHPDAPLEWRVVPGKGAAADVAADPLVLAELARLRSEYDLR